MLAEDPRLLKNAEADLLRIVGEKIKIKKKQIEDFRTETYAMGEG